MRAAEPGGVPAGDAALFGFSPGLPALRQRLRDFMDQQVIPQERPALAHDLPAIATLAR